MTSPKPETKFLMGSKAICEFLGIGATRLKNWRKRGLPIRKVDGFLVAHKGQLEAFIKEYLQKGE